MTQEERNAFFESVVKEELETMKTKSTDYDSSEDILNSFKQVAELSGISIDKVFLVLFALKFTRMRSVIENTEKPNYESLEDSIMDFRNYLFLYKCVKHNGKQ